MRERVCLFIFSVSLGCAWRKPNDTGDQRRTTRRDVRSTKASAFVGGDLPMVNFLFFFFFFIPDYTHQLPYSTATTANQIDSLAKKNNNNNTALPYSNRQTATCVLAILSDSHNHSFFFLSFLGIALLLYDNSCVIFLVCFRTVGTPSGRLRPGVYVIEVRERAMKLFKAEKYRRRRSSSAPSAMQKARCMRHVHSKSSSLNFRHPL